MADSTLKFPTKTLLVVGLSGIALAALITLLFPSLMVVGISIWWLMEVFFWIPMVVFSLVMRYSSKKPYTAALLLTLGLSIGLAFVLDYFFPVATLQLPWPQWSLVIGFMTLSFFLIFTPIIRRELAEPGWLRRAINDAMEEDRVKWEKNPTLLATLGFIIGWGRIPKKAP
jgi:hypothetical protein